VCQNPGVAPGYANAQPPGRDKIANALMASLAQNVGENPRHVAWNNNNTEFEGGRQNMMGFSCMKVVFEHTPYLHNRKKYDYCTQHSGVSLTRKPASQQRNTIKKYRRSDLICCLAVMKLARSVFTYKK